MGDAEAMDLFRHTTELANHVGIQKRIRKFIFSFKALLL